MADAAYTAPEVLRDGELSEQADVYGLGAVLYLALTGQSPFPAQTGESADGVVLRVLREPPPEVSGRDVPKALSGLLMRMMAKEPDARPDAATVLHEFEVLLTAAPAEDDLDFDDFSDELAAARIVPVATISAKPKKPAKPVKPKKKVPRGLLIGAAAVVSLVAVVPVVFQPGQDDEAAVPKPTPVASTATSPPATTWTPTTITLKPPQDKGTSVVLTWSFPKELDRYAVIVAEQGAATAAVGYSGPKTSATIPVSPGLKYCFQIQGVTSVDMYLSARTGIRGATCIGKR